MISLISSTIIATASFLLFLLPGCLFLNTYWGSDKGSLEANNLYKYVIWGILVSVFIYPLASLLLNNCVFRWLKITLSFDNIFIELFSSPPKLDALSTNFWIILLFFIGTLLLAYFLGKLIRYIIFRFNLDIKFISLRYRNDWFYLLSGRQLLFLNKEELYNVRSYYVEVDILSELGKSLVLYKGKVHDYKLKNEALEFLYLTDVRRTKIEIDKSEDEFKNNFFQKDVSYKISGSINKNGDTDISISMISPPKAKATSINNEFDLPTPEYFKFKQDVMVFKADGIKNINIRYEEFPAIT